MESLAKSFRHCSLTQKCYDCFLHINARLVSMRLEGLLHVQQLVVDQIVLFVISERDLGLMILLLRLVVHNVKLIGSSLGHLLLHL